MRCRSLPNKLVVLAAVLWVTAAGADSLEAADEALEEARAQFLIAYTALRSGLLPRAEVESEALQAYPLYPYLQAAVLERDLDDARGSWTPADAQAEAFLELYDVEPVGRDVRRAWLRSLARRGEWEAFLEQYQAGVSDATLRCQRLQAHIALEDANLAETLGVELWLTPHQLPTECEPAFQWLRERDAFGEDLVEQRVRLLLGSGQAGFARVVAGRLPEERAAGLLQWADLIEQPRRSIDRVIAAEEAAIEADALNDGWMRLARNQPGEALERYRPLVTSRSGERGASGFAKALALGLSWDRRPEALEYFERVAEEDLDDYTLGWKARAALWADDWTAAERSIAAMSAQERGHSRWRYWAARAAEQLGDRERAHALYASLLPNDNYYAAMAAARLGQRAQPNAEPLPVDEKRLTQLAATPSFLRARELFATRLHPQAVSEWLFGFGALADEDRAQAIHLAARWGRHDVSVASATRQRVFNDYALLYPRPFDEHVQAAAELADLEAELIYGVIRQESLFRADAVSPAGALGAAQLMLDTAQRTARQWSLPAPRRIDLFDPAVNIRLAAAHLRDLHDRFDNRTVVALAGYNAGPNAAERWLPDRTLDADIWVENIPFNETREYVQRVLWHSVVFAWLRTGNAQNTDAWIVRVGPPAEETLADAAAAP